MSKAAKCDKCGGDICKPLTYKIPKSALKKYEMPGVAQMQKRVTDAYRCWLGAVDTALSAFAYYSQCSHRKIVQEEYQGGAPFGIRVSCDAGHDLHICMICSYFQPEVPSLAEQIEAKRKKLNEETLDGETSEE